MYNFLEWVIERAALDPDAANCAILVVLLLVFMILTVVIAIGKPLK